MTMSPFRSIQAVAGMLTLFLLAACAGYEPLPEREPLRIAVAPVINESGLAQFSAPLARTLREDLAHNPHWRLVSDPDDAEVVLRVTVLEKVRETVARDPTDTGRPLSFYESLRLALTWESDFPAPWSPAERALVEVDTLLYAQPGTAETERAALSELARDASRNILEKLR
ncbi:MAG: LPS assembly lipoprotein LptE [Oceanipulchritudo sp.]